MDVKIWEKQADLAMIGTVMATSPAFHHGHAEAALDGRVFCGGTFVVQLFSLAESHENFRTTVLIEIETEWHERQSFFVSPHCKSAILAAVHEQLARPFRLVVEMVGLAVLRDVRPDEPNLAFDDAAISLRERNRSDSQTFDLATDQHNSTFECVKNGIIVPRFAVFTDHPLVRIFRNFFLLFGWHERNLITEKPLNIDYRFVVALPPVARFWVAACFERR